MIQFDNVSLDFGGHRLFENASFSIQKGEKCGLVGRNGSGKSSLFRLMNKELEADDGTITISKNYRLGILKQHIHFTAPTLLSEAILALPQESQDDTYKAEKILFGLGFSENDLQKSPQLFSGGYQLRLHLAKVLLQEPDCLLLDEPTNYLDLLSLRWLAKFLKRWQGECILISHDRDFMDSITSHTIGIHRQSIRKIKGQTLDFYSQILEEERIHERTRQKQEKKREHLESFVERFGAKASKASQANARKKQLEKEPVLEELQQLAHLGFSFPEAPFHSKKMVEAHAISFSYSPTTPLIENISLEIQKGDRVAIIGKNGRGKSTLLRLLLGELCPQKGNVEIAKQAEIGYFGQTDIERLARDHKIEEEIHTANPKLSIQECKGIAGLMMFTGDLAEKPISVLSGGERSRVLLGKIIAKPCNLLLLDEPTHHLDVESIEALIDALENFTGAVVIVTHSELILRRLELTKIIVCEDGKQYTHLGTYDELLEKNGLHEDEKTQVQPKKEKDTTRHERAQLIIKRSTALKPLEKKIQECEKKLIQLEEAQKKDQAELEKGSCDVELMKKVGIRQKEITQAEEELYAAYEKYETEKKAWENVIE